jgi:hypothetical protein
MLLRLFSLPVFFVVAVAVIAIAMAAAVTAITIMAPIFLIFEVLGAV